MFVGREHELAALAAVLGRGSALVVIEGEPGIGKTRLLDEACASLTGHTVLLATCPPLSEPFTLGAIVDGIRRLRPELTRVGLSAAGGALRPLFPEWADQLPPLLDPLDDARETRHRQLRALIELIERLGVDVLVVEDAHWADAATLELLLMVATAGRGGDMSLVVTYRPAELPEDSALLRLTSRPPAELERLRIELAALAVTETQLMVGSILGTEQRVSDRFATFLQEHTDGVPLAVDECVRLLRERGDIVRRGDRWTRRVLDELEVPPTVRDSVLERVARLTPEARRVLEAAAVLAEPAVEPLLTAVSELPEPEARRGLAAALASGLLLEAAPARFAFRHGLDAQAVSGAVPASRWRRLHGLAAQAVERHEPNATVRLSRHFREAGDTEAWCAHAEGAAELALQSGDDRSAATMLVQVLTKVEHPIERRVRLAHKLGEAAFFGVAALGELADQVAGALRQVLGDPRLPAAERGELRLLMSRMLWRAGRQGTAFEEVEAAVPDLGHRPDLACLAMCNLALPVAPDWPAARHLGWLRRASDLVGQAGSSLAEVAVMTTRPTALLMLGEEEGWHAAAELLDRSVAGRREQHDLAGGLLNVAEATLVWGRYADTRRGLQAAAARTEEAGHHRLVDTVRVVEAFLAWYTGDWQGLPEAVATLAASDDVEPHEQLLTRQILGLLDLVAGRRREAERRLREVSDEHTRLGAADPVGALAPAALGRLCLADDAASEALRWTMPAVEIITRKGVWLWATDIAPVHLGGLVETGRAARAESFVDDFAAGLHGRHAPAPAAALVGCRALMAEATGDLDRAAALFGEAAAAWAALPRPYDELLALERRGRCLLSAGRKAEGMDELIDTRTRLEKLGARWDSDRIAHLLRRHGFDVSRTWRRGPRGYGNELSPREREVLALVARGMTNREVAQMLFLSPKTVGRHLGTAMRKLDVSTRTAAAMAAAEAGLISAEPDTSTP